MDQHIPTEIKDNSFFYKGICIHDIKNRVLRLINIVKVMINDKESRFHALIDDDTNEFFLFETFDNTKMEINKYYTFINKSNSETFVVEEVHFN
jgi:hypothetical protein